MVRVFKILNSNKCMGVNFIMYKLIKLDILQAAVDW